MNAERKAKEELAKLIAEKKEQLQRQEKEKEQRQIELAKEASEKKEAAKHRAEKKRAIEEEGGAMAVATGLAFKLYDALKCLEDSPESRDFKTKVLDYLSGTKEVKHTNNDEIDVGSDEEDRKHTEKGTYQDQFLFVYFSHFLTVSKS